MAHPHLLNRPRANLATDAAYAPDPDPPPSPHVSNTTIAPEASVPTDVTKSTLLDFYSECPSESLDFAGVVHGLPPYIEFLQTTEPIALASFALCFNTILDSCCTMHIIRDRSLFWTYNTMLATPVGTVNCSILMTLARSEVHFCVILNGIEHTVHLRECLHAPDVPINLFSVGVMQEKEHVLVFGPKVTTIHLPQVMTSWKGLTIEAMFMRRLSFLHCDFLLPLTAPGLSLIVVSGPTAPPDDTPNVFFPCIPADFGLWHCHIGHLGMEVTKDLLTKPYATGITYDGDLTHQHCIPCLIGKHPQQPFPHHHHRASKICELLHMDTCGPFSVETLFGTSMFLVILDDFSNFRHTDLMAKKNNAFQYYLAVEARWEWKSGNHVLTLRSDSAKEFVEGPFGAHLQTRGITHQVAAVYAHPQNSKVECYIRTLKETAQMLLADSGLPAEFYSDAVLATQYLRNHLPTLTLSGIVTSYKVMDQQKPDLSHLRVWGCQCFVLIPHEKHVKDGPKRFKAIFVSYEDDRVGWCYHDTKGKYGFSHDIIFNENVCGSLQQSHSVVLPTSASPPRSPSPCPHRLQTLTDRGHDWADAIRVCDERYQHLRTHGFFALMLHPQQSLVAISDFLSLFALADLPDTPDDLPSLEFPILFEQTCLIVFPDPLSPRSPSTFPRLWRTIVKLWLDLMWTSGMLRWIVKCQVSRNRMFFNQWSYRLDGRPLGLGGSLHTSTTLTVLSSRVRRRLS